MVAAILTGGQNRRLPFLKGFIEAGGKRLLESQVELLSGIAERVVISANSPELYFYLGLPVIGDVVKPAGPLSGILSVLLCTGSDEVFVTACDMPFIKPELVRYIIENRAGQATVPVFGGRPEPLLAVYSREVTETAEEMLREGRGVLTELLGRIDVNYIEEKDVRRMDPEGRSFININTLTDFERAFSGGKTCSV